MDTDASSGEEEAREDHPDVLGERLIKLLIHAAAMIV